MLSSLDIVDQRKYEIENSQKIERTSDKQAKNTDKLCILTFTELLLHGVSDSVNGGVVFSIQDIGRWWSVGDGHQLWGGDLAANSNGEYYNVLRSCLHTGIHLKKQAVCGEIESPIVKRIFIQANTDKERQRQKYNTQSQQLS